jgi:hypothetical protein
MGTHMKTTIDINDSLLLEAKQLAARQNQTLKSVLELALWQFLEANAESRSSFRLRKHTVRGRGLQPGITEGDWNTLRTSIYEGRGG